MDLNLRLAIISLIVSALLNIAAIAVSIWIWRRSRPNQKLAISKRSFALLSDDAPSLNSDVSVSYQDKQLTKPFVTEIEIWSKGRNDIPSTAFDSGQPITITVSTELLAEVSKQSDFEVSSDGRTIALSPRLLKTGDRVIGTFLSDGRPTVGAPTVPLTDIDHEVIDGDRPQIIMGQPVYVEDLLRPEKSGFLSGVAGPLVGAAGTITVGSLIVSALYLATLFNN